MKLDSIYWLSKYYRNRHGLVFINLRIDGQTHTVSGRLGFNQHMNAILMYRYGAA